MPPVFLHPRTTVASSTAVHTRGVATIANSSEPRIVSRSQALPNRIRPVTVLYEHRGQPQRTVIEVTRPTQFEEVVLSLCRETTEPPTLSVWPGNARDVPRAATRAIRNAYSRFAPPLRCEYPVFDTRKFEPNNIAHLLLDLVPVGLFVQNTLGRDAKSAFRKVVGPFRHVVDLFELGALCTHRRIDAEIIHVRGTRGLAVYDLLGTFDCPAITFLPNVYSGRSFPPSHRIEKVFLARRGARALLNHTDVAEFLSTLGFQTIFLEDYPIQQQLAIVAQAKHVVAVHGAGMAGLVLNPAIESVVEILPPHVYHQLFPMCLGDRVKRYALLMPEYDETVQHRGWDTLSRLKNAPFRIEIGAVDRALCEVQG